MTQKLSPNFNARKSTIDMIVLHYTETVPLQAVIDRLCDPAAEVSAHYVVDVDGRVIKLVAEDNRAWHAGVSSWQGQSDINSRSIGIEIVNDGVSPFAPAQIAAVIELCRDIQKRHGIKDCNIVAHSDIAPKRKIDPGAFFPWAHLAKQGVGHWPRPRLSDYFNQVALKRDDAKLRHLLAKAGYGFDFGGTKLGTREVLAAFQLRYDTKAPAGVPTRDTLAKLRAVARYNARNGR